MRKRKGDWHRKVPLTAAKLLGRGRGLRGGVGVGGERAKRGVADSKEGRRGEEGGGKEKKGEEGGKEGGGLAPQLPLTTAKLLGGWR
jgi:hypothetical protein